MKSTVSARGQVVIPKPLRDRLGLGVGQVLDFQVEGGRLVAHKVAPADQLTAVYGILKLDEGTDAFVDLLRGGVDLT